MLLTSSTLQIIVHYEGLGLVLLCGERVKIQKENLGVRKGVGDGERQGN